MAFFPINHPKFIGCHFTFDHIDLYTKKKVKRIYRQTGAQTSFPLKIPANLNFPPEVVLFRNRTVQALFSQKYVPTVVNGAMTFVSPSKEILQRPFLEQLASTGVQICQEIGQIEDRHKKTIKGDDETSSDTDSDEEKNEDTLRELRATLHTLDTFKSYVENQQFSLADDCIRRAYESLPLRVKALHADFLYLHKKRDAANFFLEIANAHQGVVAVPYLKKGLFADPGNALIYNKLIRLVCSEEKELVQLFVFLHLSKTDPQKAEQFYQSMVEEEPDEPLIYYAYLSTFEDAKERNAVYNKLANHFIRKGNTIYTYYLRKSLIEHFRNEESLRNFFAKQRKDINQFQKVRHGNLRFAITTKLRKSYLEYIDTLIERQLFEEALKVSDKALRVLKQKDRVETAVFDKRNVTIYAKLKRADDLKYYLFKLFDYYNEKSNFVKAELVIRCLYQQFRDFSTCLRFINFLDAHGQKEESARVCFEIAKAEATANQMKNVYVFLEALQRIDTVPSSLKPDEQIIVNLLLRNAELAVPLLYKE